MHQTTWWRMLENNWTILKQVIPTFKKHLLRPQYDVGDLRQEGNERFQSSNTQYKSETSKLDSNILVSQNLYLYFKNSENPMTLMGQFQTDGENGEVVDEN